MAFSLNVNAIGLMKLLESDDPVLIDKINEIACEEYSRKDQGYIIINDDIYCHWSSDSHRIFGLYNSSTKQLDLYGVGLHTGNDISSYMVSWHDGTEKRVRTY